MIDIKEYEEMLRNLGGQFFVKDITFVPDISSWAREHGQALGEPYAPMKLVAADDDTLFMIVQEEISDEMLDGPIKNLSLRSSVRDNVTDLDAKLNSVKKRIVYSFLKERSHTMKDIGGNELVEDQWVLDEMEELNFFKE